MIDKPLVSVIMPAYNAEKYIAQSIQSIENQSYDNWELIVIDDGSTDGTKKVISDFNDKRIRFIENYENKGIAYTTNRAISFSKGKYIALLDDDDISLPKRLEIQTAILEEKESIDILGGRTLYIDENNKIIGSSEIPRYNPNYYKAMLLLTGVDFANSTGFIRKSFIDKYNLSYKENLYGMQDMNFYMESSKIGEISAIDEYVLMHRLHDENQTKKIMRNNNDERIKKYAEIQRSSFEKSGFILEDKNLALINKVYSEYNGKFDSFSEMKDMYEIFHNILFQAKKMHISYLNELNHYLRLKFMEKARAYENFFVDKVF